MLDRESSFAAGACVGLLRRADFTARTGTLILLKWQLTGMRASAHPYTGTLPQDVAVLLVLSGAASTTLQQQGLAVLRVLIRQGAAHPYILKTMRELEAGGLEDFIEDLWLTAPHH